MGARLPGRDATLEEVREHNYVLTPGRFVGAEEVEDEDEPFGEKIAKLVEQLESEFKRSGELEKLIRVRLRSVTSGF